MPDPGGRLFPEPVEFVCVCCFRCMDDDSPEYIWSVGGTKPHREWLRENWEALLVWLGSEVPEDLKERVSWSEELQRGPHGCLEALGSTVQAQWREGKVSSENATGLLRPETKSPPGGECNVWQEYVLSGSSQKMFVRAGNMLPPELLQAGRYFREVGLTDEEFGELSSSHFALMVADRVPVSVDGSWDFGPTVRAILGVMMVFKCFKGKEPSDWSDLQAKLTIPGEDRLRVMKIRKLAASSKKGSTAKAPSGRVATAGSDAKTGKQGLAKAPSGKVASAGLDAKTPKVHVNIQKLVAAKAPSGRVATAGSGRRVPGDPKRQGPAKASSGRMTGTASGAKVDKRSHKSKDSGKQNPGDSKSKSRKPSRGKAGGKQKTSGRDRGGVFNRYIDARDAGQGYTGMFREHLLYGNCSSSEGPHPQGANTSLLGSEESDRKLRQVASGDQVRGEAGAEAFNQYGCLGTAMGIGITDVRDSLHEGILDMHAGFWTAVDQVWNDLSEHDQGVVAGFRAQGLGYMVCLWRVAVFQQHGRSTCSGCGRGGALQMASKCECISYTCGQCRQWSRHQCLSRKYTEVYSNALRQVDQRLRDGFAGNLAIVSVLLNQILLPLRCSGSKQGEPQHLGGSQHHGVMQCRLSDHRRSMEGLEKYLESQPVSEAMIRQMRRGRFGAAELEVFFLEKVACEDEADLVLEVRVPRGSRKEVQRAVVPVRVRSRAENFRHGGMVELVHAFPWWSESFFLVAGARAFRYLKHELDDVLQRAIIMPFLTERRALTRTRDIPDAVEGCTHTRPGEVCKGVTPGLVTAFIQRHYGNVARGPGGRRQRAQAPRPLPAGDVQSKVADPPPREVPRRPWFRRQCKVPGRHRPRWMRPQRSVGRNSWSRRGCWSKWQRA